MTVSSATVLHLSGHLESIAVGEVRVRRRDRQDDSVGVVDVLHAHAANLILYIGRLIARRHLPERHAPPPPNATPAHNQQRAQARDAQTEVLTAAPVRSGVLSLTESGDGYLTTPTDRSVLVNKDPQ